MSADTYFRAQVDRKNRNERMPPSWSCIVCAQPAGGPHVARQLPKIGVRPEIRGFQKVLPKKKSSFGVEIQMSADTYFRAHGFVFCSVSKCKNVVSVNTL